MIILQAVSPQDFFTVGTFTTLAGSTGIVYIVCGAIQQAFNYNPKWLAFIISIFISFVAAYIAIAMVPEVKSRSTAQTFMLEHQGIVYLLALLNGFLIYMTASGANKLIADGPQANRLSQRMQPPTAFPSSPVPRTFTSAW